MNTTTLRQTNTHSESDCYATFVTGGGITGDLFRSIDWSESALGRPGAWPEALKISLNILFHSRHPMFIWWGPELVQFYNDAFLPSFGQSKHPTAMGQRGQECWPEIWPIICPQIESVMRQGKSTWHKNQLVPVFRNGALEDVYWTYGYSGIYNSDGSIGGTLVVCTETSESARLQQSSLAQKSAIEQLRAERTLREQFVATLTHDLRNPLAAAKITAQLISRLGSGSGDRTSVLIGRIVDNLDRANQMIENLLDANRVKAGEALELEMSEVGLVPLVRSTLSELASIHGDRFVLVSEATDLVGHWNSDGVRRIIENLCGNAVKYGEESGLITVSLQSEPGHVSLSVHNSGNPISSVDQLRLFDPFQRVRNAGSRNIKGWGLGLTLVRGIAEAHGGKVSVASSTQEGTTFKVTLKGRT